MQKLSISDHSRDIAGLKYVYPVISRRSGGLSIGINFNTNNACNWHCVYCQVPNLVRGSAPPIDFSLLGSELRFFLDQIKNGAFYRQFAVSTELQQIKDIALSGNGEPTSVADFDQAIDLIATIAMEYQVFPKARFVLISNGSLMHQTKVQQGLKRLQHYGGEVWFKIDSGSLAGRKAINGCRDDNNKILQKLQQSAERCHTKIQSCLLDYDVFPWNQDARQAFLAFFQQIKQTTVVNQVMLYTLARPSLQPEASKITAIQPSQIQFFARELEKQGFNVSVA
jgi:wyosine [tRNA(Phe)-imidazoG37] synthetase (radical SAM superfamily)